jgi:hypothetical protein
MSDTRAPQQPASKIVYEFASLQRLALAGETGECSAFEACGEIANRLPHLLAMVAAPVAQQPAPDMAEYWQRRAECAEESEQRILDSIAAQQPAEPLREALARLWPGIERAMRGMVYTADKAGEVAADMQTIRAALAHPPAADNRLRELTDEHSPNLNDNDARYDYPGSRADELRDRLITALHDLDVCQRRLEDGMQGAGRLVYEAMEDVVAIARAALAEQAPRGEG